MFAYGCNNCCEKDQTHKLHVSVTFKKGVAMDKTANTAVFPVMSFCCHQLSL